LVPKSGVGAGLGLLVNFALPFLIYTITKSPLGNVRALKIGSFEAMRDRPAFRRAR
jgi:hypothetical protein